MDKYTSVIQALISTMSHRPLYQCLVSLTIPTKQSKRCVNGWAKSNYCQLRTHTHALTHSDEYHNCIITKSFERERASRIAWSPAFIASFSCCLNTLFTHESSLARHNAFRNRATSLTNNRSRSRRRRDISD